MSEVKTSYYSRQELELSDPVLEENVVGVFVVKPNEVEHPEKSRRVRHSTRRGF